MLVKDVGEGEKYGVGQPHGCHGILVIQWARYMLETGKSCSLLDLLSQSWFRQATDIRDSIYGLCALASDVEKLGIIPNYNASVESVLTEAVEKLLLEYGTFELFAKAGCGVDRRLAGIPSYVPDWTSIPIAQPLHTYSARGPHTVPAHERSVSKHKSGKMQLKMYKLDAIELVSTALTSNGEKFELEQLLSWFKVVENLAITHARNPYNMMIPACPDIPLFEAFWRTLIADSTSFSTRSSIRPDSDAYHGYLRWIFQASRDCGIAPTSLFEDFAEHSDRYGNPMDDSLAKMMEFHNQMLIITWGRAICVTRCGMVGLVPGGARPGDLVCLISGGAVPYVMRMRESGNECELVGESYFHGVGAIEGVKQMRSEGKEPSVAFLV